MKGEFAPALPDLVPHLIKVIEQDEGQVETTAAPADKAQFAGLDDSDNEDENGNIVLHVRTALLEVKKGAITALVKWPRIRGRVFVPTWNPVCKCYKRRLPIGIP